MSNKKKKLGRSLLWSFLGLVAAAVVLCAVYGIWGYRLYRAALEECPLEQKVEEIRSNEHYSRLGELPVVFQEAVVAVEDHRFYSHGGIDLISIARAAWNNLCSLSFKEGRSTITQQLAKNLYFSQERKLERKAAEVFMARAIEKAYEKDEILELYVNCIYYGSGYYCIYDASVGYYDKEPWQLSDYECTVLAGLPNAPSDYDPTINPDLTAQRQAQVLEKMVRYGYLSEEEADEIAKQGEA